MISSVSIKFYAVILASFSFLSFHYIFNLFSKPKNFAVQNFDFTPSILGWKNETGNGISSPNASSVSINTIARYIEELHSHCWKGYMDHAFPADELKPISCSPKNPTFGNVSLTLIDSLDSLMIFGKISEFIDAINYISSDKISFSSDINVSTFETNIRVLGGILSGHIFSTFLSNQLSKYRELSAGKFPNGDAGSDTVFCASFHRPELCKSFARLSPTHLNFQYNGEVLRKAAQLGRRLQEAFDVETHLPYSSINLKHGRLPLSIESDFVSTADAGTYLVEFGVLSLLTNDESFYLTARKASLYMWNQRSEIDLVGAYWMVSSGMLLVETCGIGGGLDSFFEYLYKAGKLFSDAQLSEAFQIASAALMKHCQTRGVYSNCNIYDGHIAQPNRLYSLGAFWPGLLAISGDIPDALQSYFTFLNVWRKFHLLPEKYDIEADEPINYSHNLRPEFYESTFYLSQFFHYYLKEIARDIVLPAYNKLNSTLRTPCGVAAQRDVRNATSLDDSMESYFISETLVYLYLIVVERDVIEQRLPAPLSHMVFSTEAHLFPLPEMYPELYVGLAGQPGVDEVRSRLGRMTKLSESHRQCPLYQFHRAHLGYF